MTVDSSAPATRTSACAGASRFACARRARPVTRSTPGCSTADPGEYDRLVRSLTINVTKFFRNWDTYAALDQKVIPALWERGERELRVWSAGCSSGEEPYSAAILMHKHAAETGQLSRLDSVSIVGTDIDTDSLGEAERAFYGESALGDTPAELRERYFPPVAGNVHDASRGQTARRRFSCATCSGRRRRWKTSTSSCAGTSSSTSSARPRTLCSRNSIGRLHPVASSFSGKWKPSSAIPAACFRR